MMQQYLEFPSKYVFHDKFIMCVKLTDILAKKKKYIGVQTQIIISEMSMFSEKQRGE